MNEVKGKEAMVHFVRATLGLLLAFGVCFSVGCSDKSSEPENSPPPAGMKHLWSKRFGDESNQYAQAVAVDTSGTVIVTGVFEGAVDFGGGALASAGQKDIFVAKFGSDGAHIWSKRFGDGNEQYAEAIAVDASGNVIVVGYFNGTVDFGGGALMSAGQGDIFIAKFGSDGAHLWSKFFGDEDAQYAQSVAVDASGNVIVVGYFNGTVDFGDGALVSAGQSDIFIAKFGSDGAHLWSKRFGDGEAQPYAVVAADASGDIVLTGWFRGTVDFGGGALTNAGAGWDTFIAKIGSDGAHIWSKRFGDEDYQIAHAVAMDASGNVVVAGYFTGTVDFGGGALTGVGYYDVFVAKFGPDGAHLWSSRFGDGGEQAASGVAVDALDNVIITGNFKGAVDFGGGALESAGEYDIFVAEFEPTGAHVRSQSFGDRNTQFVQATAADTSGSVMITGSFHGAVDFGGGILTAAGLSDIFIAKFGR